jgi:hypothetical protein
VTSTAIILGFRLPPGAEEADVRQLAVGSLQPTLALLDAHPEVRVGLVLSGEALRSLDAYDSSLVDGIRARIEAGRVEAIATALYEPLFGDIPEDDALAQVQSHLALVRQRLNVRPRGLALPWMVWSESVARIARRCELEWVFVPGVQGVVSLEHEGASVRGLGCEALAFGSARNGRGASWGSWVKAPRPKRGSRAYCQKRSRSCHRRPSRGGFRLRE